MEKNRYYVELPGDVWEEGTLMNLIRCNQEKRVGAGAGRLGWAWVLALGWVCWAGVLTLGGRGLRTGG